MMNWRDKMGTAKKNEHSEPYAQNTQNTQKGIDRGAFETIGDIEYGISDNKKSIRSWAMDSPIIGQVAIAYDENKPDQVLVDGVQYGQGEVRNLISRVIDRETLKNVHEVKRQFAGQIQPEKGGDAMK